jgi:hypothetical protein
MSIPTKKVSRVPEEVKKGLEVAKEIAPVVAEVAVTLAPKKDKHDVKVKVAAGLSILYIVIDLITKFL